MMICYVCKEEIEEEDHFIRLDSEHARHEPHCAPLTKNFRKAFPQAWSNRYVQEERDPEPIQYRRLLRLKEKP